MSITGCATCRIVDSVSTKEEPGSVKIFISQAPHGYTGMMKIKIEQSVSLFEVRKQEKVRERKLIKPAAPLYVVVGAAFLFPVVYDAISLARGEAPTFFTEDSLMNKREVGREAINDPKTKFIKTFFRPMKGQDLRISVPEAQLSGNTRSDENGEVEFHILEPVLETKGRSDLTISFSLQDGTKSTYELSQAEAVLMLQMYRDALREQANSIYHEIVDLTRENQTLSREAALLQFQNQRFKKELSRLRAENASLEQEIVILQRRNESLKEARRRILDQNEELGAIKQNNVMVKAVLYGGKLTTDSALAAAHVYENYRLIKSGLTISRAFKLTLPSFVAGWVTEEIIWTIIQKKIT